MSEIKLLPCPFCGGEAKAHSRCSYEETGGETMFFVRCNNCGSEGTWCYSKDNSIKSWNTRKPIKNIIEQLENEKKMSTLYVYAVGAYQKAIDIIKKEFKEEML